MNYETIRISEKFGGEAFDVTLNAPPANILSAKMMNEISHFMRESHHDPKLKIVIFKGEGENFSFGASVEEHTADQIEFMLPVFHKMIGEILEHPAVTLAQVRGLCLGGGFELALACSFIAADETAKFAVPEIQLGVFPPVAAALLPHMSNNSVALKMILTGTRLGSAELRDAGLVTFIADENGIETAVDAFFEKELKPKSASSLRLAHRASRAAIVQTYRGQIGELEKLYLDELMKTRDANEGIGAFIEKRRPVWTNN